VYPATVTLDETAGGWRDSDARPQVNPDRPAGGGKVTDRW